MERAKQVLGFGLYRAKEGGEAMAGAERPSMAMRLAGLICNQGKVLIEKETKEGVKGEVMSVLHFALK